MRAVPYATSQMALELYIKVASNPEVNAYQFENIRYKYLNMGRTGMSLRRQILDMPYKQLQYMYVDLKSINSCPNLIP